VPLKNKNNNCVTACCKRRIKIAVDNNPYPVENDVRYCNYHFFITKNNMCINTGFAFLTCCIQKNDALN